MYPGRHAGWVYLRVCTMVGILQGANPAKTPRNREKKRRETPLKPLETGRRRGNHAGYTTLGICRVCTPGYMSRYTPFVGSPRLPASCRPHCVAGTSSPGVARIYTFSSVVEDRRAGREEGGLFSPQEITLLPGETGGFWPTIPTQRVTLHKDDENVQTPHQLTSNLPQG